MGFLIHILVSLVVGAIGGALLGLIGIGGTNIIGDIIVAVVGACICIWVARLVLK